MIINQVELGIRIRAVRETQRISQYQAARALGLPQTAYADIEAGDRLLAGDELVILADLLGVRAASIAEMPELREQATFAVGVGEAASPAKTMREKLYAYLELDAYLTSQGML